MADPESPWSEMSPGVAQRDPYFLGSATHEAFGAGDGLSPSAPLPSSSPGMPHANPAPVGDTPLHHGAASTPGAAATPATAGWSMIGSMGAGIEEDMPATASQPAAITMPWHRD